MKSASARFVCMFLSCVLLLGLLPVAALAESEPGAGQQLAGGAATEGVEENDEAEAEDSDGDNTLEESVEGTIPKDAIQPEDLSKAETPPVPEEPVTPATEESPAAPEDVSPAEDGLAGAPENEPSAVSGDWTYTVSGNAATIIAYTGSDSEVTIPDTLGGVAVTAVGDRAFSYCRNITRIVMPNTIRTLGVSAFEQCISLKNITLSTALTNLPEYVFSNCSLTAIHIPKNVKTIHNQAFFRTAQLAALTVDSSNASFSAVGNVLYNKAKTTLLHCPQGLTKVTFAGTVKSIGSYAFMYCNKITSLVVPASVTKLAENAFFDCAALASLKISGAKSMGSPLVQNCASLTTFTLGKGPTELPHNMIVNCKNLKTINLPEKLKTINAYAVINCPALGKISIPKSVTLVNTNAFASCPKAVIKGKSKALKKMENGAYMKVDTIKVKGVRYYKEAYQVLKTVNKERKKAGLSALKMDKELLEAAMVRAAEINVDYNHDRPMGLGCGSISDKMNSENIAVGYYTPAAVMSGWMDSDGHRANILRSTARSIGVGCFKQKDGRWFWVQVFSSQKATAVKKTANKTKTQTVRVTPGKYKFTVQGKSITLKKGKKTTPVIRTRAGGWWSYPSILAKSFKWKSSKPSVAKVSSAGRITGVRRGKATVTASTDTGKKVKCKVKVK